MLTVVCVEHGNYLGRGKEYVNVLADSVRRTLHVEHRFVCFTDDPEGLDDGIETRPLPGNLTGWWNKIWLFAPGHFAEGDRVIFIDLDTVILGGMDEIAKYGGDFMMLQDFYRPHGYGSGLMAWKAGFGAHIWQRFVEQGFPDVPGGDQAWLECVFAWDHFIPDTWQSTFPGRVRSYKSECRNGAPDGTWIICFHGSPRPHDCDDPYIAQFWKIGGAKLAEFKIHCNTPEQAVLDHVRHAITLDIPWVEPNTYKGHAVIVGGGPSLADNYRSLRRRKKMGHHVWALNAVHDYLIERHIVPDACCLLDARIHTVDFVRSPHPDVTYFVASQCHPDVFKALEGYKVKLWHSLGGGVGHLLNTEIGDTKPHTLVGGGNSVALKTMYLGFLLGYRHLHLYGVDSCYRDGQNHAYRQPINDGEKLEEVTVRGKTFICSRWMAAQAESFKQQWLTLAKQGCEVTAHGDGLLPFIYRKIRSGLHERAA